MADIDQLVVRWDGFTGAPGYSVFYALPGHSVRGMIFNFFDSIKVNVPTGVHWTVPLSGNTFDDATGELTGVWTETTAATGIDASGGAPNVGNAGACFTWRTNTILDGKKVRGRTFIVPLSTANYASNGTLDDAVLAAFRTKGQALVDDADGNLVVWHRPKAGAGGGHGPITLCTVTDRAAILRSRSV